LPTQNKVGLFDRDVFLKLICCDLWDETLEVESITQPYRLASTAIGGTKRVLARWFPEPAAQAVLKSRFERIISNVPVLPDEIQPSSQHLPLLVALKSTKDIDAGEAELVCILQELNDPAVMLSGDKRFLNSLKSSHPDVYASLESRLLSFEDCLIHICASKGVGLVIDRVRAGRACDGTLKHALGGHDGADVDSFMAAINSFNPCK